MKYLVLILVLCSQAWAGNWYVRKGAVGTNAGTNWTNAWNELSQVNFTTVACGDTVWIAGGTYTTSLSINKTCTSPSQLAINRVLATDAVPVAAAGWNAAFDSQVIISNAEILLHGGAFYTISGRIGTSAGNDLGIAIRCTGANGCNAFDGADTSTLDHITVDHVEMFGPTCVTAGTCSAGADGFNIAPSVHAVSNIIVQYSWIHRFSELIRCALWSNSTIQYSQLDTTAQTPAEHEDVIFSYDETNFTFRYNRVFLSPNDGIFFDGNCSNCQFYGNAYWASGGALLTFFTGFSVTTTIINNTFSSDHVNGDFLCPGNCPWMYFQSTPSSGSIIKNNIFDHIVFSGSAGTGAIDYNAYSADSGKQDTGTHSFTYTSSYTANTQFVNVSPSTPSAGNYHLTTVGAGNGLATFQGKADTTVGSQFLTDMDGNVCSVNCNVGAFQPSGSSPSASTPTFSPVAGAYTGARSVTISTTSGTVICYNTTGSPTTNGTTGCTTGTLYIGAVTVSASQTLFAVAGGTGFTDSTVASAAYVINSSLKMSGVTTMSGSAVMQ